MEKKNTATATPDKPTDALLLEAVAPLPEPAKLLILGVARGIALSANIPAAG